MKAKIVIEETISQEFEVEITDLEKGFDEIRAMYKNRTLVIENPHLIDAQLMIYDENNNETDWNCLM